MSATEWVGLIAAILTAVSPLYLSAWRRRRNGNGDGAKWNHRHAETLSEHGETIAEFRDTLTEHKTAVAILQHEMAVNSKRLEVVGGRVHDLANDMTAVMMKLDIRRRE